MSGVFVDGEFIRGWAGSAERGSGARLHMSLTDPSRTILPLDYLGRIAEGKTSDGEIAEWWAGPCGAHIVHFRPAEKEDLWTGYLGGDPRAKKTKAGRAYIALVSANEYWVIAALQSFKKHFSRARRFLVTRGLPTNWTAFTPIDRSDPDQARDLVIVDSINAAAQTGEMFPAQVVIKTDAGVRFMAKLGLAIGCQLFGAEFGDHPEGEKLRRFFRQPDPKLRNDIPVHGAGYFSGDMVQADVLNWPGGWVLVIQMVHDRLALSVVTPSGRRMVVQITADAALIARLEACYKEGMAWIVVPSISTAIGPIALPDYVAHIAKVIPNAELADIENARIDPSKLPPC